MRFFVAILALSFGLISCSHHQAPVSPATGEKAGKEIDKRKSFYLFKLKPLSVKQS